MRYFIHLAYNGSKFSGWQRQKETHNTIQETIEQALFKIFKKKIGVYGCGRTDSGVHASQYIIQINIDKKPLFDLKFRLNKSLPDEIAVYEIIPVTEDKHCRHDTSSRTYDYFIHWKKDPILNQYSSFYDNIILDFELMKKAARLILLATNFKGLCKQPETYNNTLCAIYNSEVFIDEERGRLRYTITGNRFLRGMVRICVFFLLEVGKRKISLQEFEQILNLKIDLKEKKPAYPNGLFLSKVEYPFLKLDNNHNIISMLKFGLE